MTLDASGNLGVGTTSPGARLTVAGGRIQVTGNTAPSSGTGLELFYDGTGAGTLAFARGTGYIPNFMDGSQLQFFTSSTERARIDSNGTFLIGTTGVNGVGWTITPSGSGQIRSSGTGAQDKIQFANSNGVVGAITTTGVATAYNTSSDYRLKEDVQPMTNALEKVAQLKPVTYKWKADGSAGEGFIAHELAEVCPHAVSGEKDAVDEDGNPKYQGIDVSFLVGTLTAAIQELNAKIDAQAAEIAALKAKLV